MLAIDHALLKDLERFGNGRNTAVRLQVKSGCLPDNRLIPLGRMMPSLHL